MGIKVYVLKFREDLFSRVFNFAIFFFYNREEREIKDQRNYGTNKVVYDVIK